MWSNSLLRAGDSQTSLPWICKCSETRQTGSSLTMAQDAPNLTGLDCFEGNTPHCSDTDALSQGDKEYDDILELNQFDGLPYSSRFYKLLRERKELPVWKAKSDFMDTLAKEQFVIVSGCAKTGRSSQVSTVMAFAMGKYDTLYSGKSGLNCNQLRAGRTCGVNSLSHSYFETDSPVVCRILPVSPFPAWNGGVYPNSRAAGSGPRLEGV